MNIILIIIGFILLVKGVDLLVDGLSKVESSLGISSLIVELTIDAFETNDHETAISLISVINCQPGITLWNIVDLNICIFLLVLGICGLFGDFTLRKKII